MRLFNFSSFSLVLFAAWNCCPLANISSVLTFKLSISNVSNETVSSNFWIYLKLNHNQLKIQKLIKEQYFKKKIKILENTFNSSS